MSDNISLDRCAPYWGRRVEIEAVRDGLSSIDRMRCIFCNAKFSIVGDGPYNKCVQLKMPAVWIAVFGYNPTLWVHSKCVDEAENMRKFFEVRIYPPSSLEPVNL